MVLSKSHDISNGRYWDATISVSEGESCLHLIPVASRCEPVLQFQVFGCIFGVMHRRGFLVRVHILTLTSTLSRVLFFCGQSKTRFPGRSPMRCRSAEIQRFCLAERPVDELTERAT